MDAFLKMYQELDKDNLHLLKDVYRADIEFIDPAHRLVGLDQVTGYFASLYEHVNTIRFTFADPLVQPGCGYVRWEMRFTHRRLAGGRPVTVEGATYLRFDSEQMVYYHRDYFDLGALVYEHVPLLGPLVTMIKKRLGK